MNKKILIQAGVILGIFLTIILAAVGCSKVNPEPTVASISNGDDAYLTLEGGITVTNDEIFETMMNVEGLDYLLDYVEEIILAEYFETITQDDIDKELLLLVFGTDDEEILAELESVEGLYDDYLEVFYNNLEILGYDTTDPADVAVFLKANIAKKNLTRAKIDEEIYGGSYYIYETEVETYYETTVKNDVCALTIMFSNVNEAEAVFANFNLVLNFNTGLGLYTEDATVPFEDVSSEEFVAGENTIQLTDEEVFPHYVEIYNYMNPYAEQLPSDITEAELCADYSDISLFNYSDMTTGLKIGSTSSYYADYLFNTLDLTNEEITRFSYAPKAFGTSQMFTFKISEEPVTLFADLSDEDKAMYRAEFIETVLGDDLVSYAVDEIRNDSDFDIVDPYLQLAYYSQTGIELSGEGSDTIVATLGDLEITADDLFEYMVSRAGTFYSLEIAKVEMLLESDQFIEIYGEDPNYLSSNAGDLVAIRENLLTIKSNFGDNLYADSGFPNTIYSWSDVLYLGFGARTETEVLMQDTIMTLQADLIYPTIDFASYEDYLNLQLDEYFDLNAEHLLLYIDFDKDFKPDDYSDFIEAIDAVPADSDEYYALKGEFEGIVDTKLNAGMTFTEIVIEYNESLIGDVTSDWYNIKQYGFLLMTENLSVDGSLTYLNSSDLDDAFSVALKEIYDEFINPINVDLTHLLASTLTTTDFGVHLIDATKGSLFERPSAIYEPTDDNPDAYSAGAENTEDTPNEAQLALYNEIRFAEMKGEIAEVSLPGSVFYTISGYYDGIMNAYYNQTGYSIVAAEFVLDSNPVFASNQDASVAKINTILDILYTVNFPEEFVQPE